MFVVRANSFDTKAAWEACEKRRGMPINKLYDGTTVFPNEQVPDRKGWSLPPEAVEELKGGASITIMMTGCVDYIADSDGRHHQSRFVFEVDKSGPNQSVLRIDPSTGDVPPDQLLLMRNPSLAGDAY